MPCAVYRRCPIAWAVLAFLPCFLPGAEERWFASWLGLAFPLPLWPALVSRKFPGDFPDPLSIPCSVSIELLDRVSFRIVLDLMARLREPCGRS